MQLTRKSPLYIASLLDGVAGKIALLVDPDPDLLETRKLLLSGCSDSVLTACTFGDVFDLQHGDEPHIAILGEALGPIQLPAVAVFIRHQWPRTRILVVGQAASFLEDQLYDENVTGRFGPEEFLAAVERCRKPTVEQKEAGGMKGTRSRLGLTSKATD